MHPTCGSLRDLQAFFWLWDFPTSQILSTPAHTRVTQTVSRCIIYKNITLLAVFIFFSKCKKCIYKENTMKSLRTIAVLVGILFLVATVTFTIGSGQIRSFLSGENPQKSLLIIGVLLEIMCGVAVVGIGVLLFPILKLFHHRFAVGYVIFRSIECVIILIGGMYLLLRLQFMWNYEMIIFLFTGIGGLILSYLLYQSRLVPRWLSVLGLVGYAMLSIGTVFDMAGVMQMDGNIGMLVYLPGGLFELFLPIWLFIKGFNSSAITAASI